MGSNTLPEHLKLALQRHIEDDDLRDDSDLPVLMDKLTALSENCLLYTSPSPRDLSTSRMPSSA